MPPPPLRNGALDHLRLIAALGIVWFHTGAPGAGIGYAGLPFFLIVMILLSGPALSDMSLRHYTVNRATRLLRPWLLWSGVYAALKLAQMQISGGTWADEFAAVMLLTGPAIHLWFLPFAFVTCLTTAAVWRATAHLPATPVVLACVGLALLTAGLGQSQSLHAPAAQWIFAAPAVCLGWAFMRIGPKPVALMGALGLFGVVAIGAGWMVGLLQITIAGLALVLCTALPRPPTAFSAWAAGTAMGVYLIHPAVAAVLAQISNIPAGTTGFALLTAALSLGGITAGQRISAHYTVHRTYRARLTPYYGPIRRPRKHQTTYPAVLTPKGGSLR